MKIAKTAVLAGLLVVGVACGYSAKSTPPVAGTTPTVTQLAPSSMTAGSPSFVLTVNGTNFASNAVVNWNGAAQSTMHVSASQLTATIPAASVATAATVSITVTNPGMSGGIYGGGTSAATSNSMTFTVN
jgi:trimeric autotransporter adhesin